MLRLAPWLVLSGFKTDGWPPVPIPKASPSPKYIWSWLLPCCGWRPGWFYRVSKLTDGPRSRSQRPPQAQNVFGAGFSHAAAGALAGFIRFQNWRMAPGPDPKGLPRPKMFQNWRKAPGPDPKGFPKPKMYLELALAMLRLAPWLVLSGFKTDGWPPGLPRPKLSLELAFAMLRLAPWLVLSGFKTDGWPPAPIPKASPGPKCLGSWL